MRSCLLTIFLFLIGCSSTNTNVIQIAQTGFGLKASWNPQTQLPDVWMGYYRSVVLVLPTSSNDANRTADMVLDFHVDAGFVSGLKISDKVVIGAPARQGSNALARAVIDNNEVSRRLFDRQ